MSNFIEVLDDIYASECDINGINKNSQNFWVFEPLIVEINGKKNTNFIIRKGRFTKYLYVKDGCRVYFSDADILMMVLQIQDVEIMDWLVDKLKKAYVGETEYYYIYIRDVCYTVRGIKQKYCAQLMYNPQDIEMPFEDLIILINLVLSKDFASLPLWPTKADFSKHTCAKYISLLKYYYYGDKYAKRYLEDMGYDTNLDIYSNYKSKTAYDEKKNYFCDFDLFEKSGII